MLIFLHFCIDDTVIRHHYNNTTISRIQTDTKRENQIEIAKQASLIPPISPDQQYRLLCANDTDLCPVRAFGIVV